MTLNTLLSVLWKFIDANHSTGPLLKPVALRSLRSLVSFIISEIMYSNPTMFLKKGFKLQIVTLGILEHKVMYLVRVESK